jgi:predicted ArsR family transcriptional regulator
MQPDGGVRRDEQRLAAICGLDDPVRRRLYDYVAGCGEPVGRDEAAAATGVGRPLAAYHLDRLVVLGLLTAGYRRTAGRRGPGAGRPAKVYARSDREFAVTLPPREYELAARLLAQAVEADPSGAALAGLRRAARELGSSLTPPRPAETAAAAGQLQAMRAALAGHGFEPAADPDGSLRLRNCPFHQLAARHPGVVCAMNLALLEGVAAGIGAGGIEPVLEPDPGRCCVVVRTREHPRPEKLERHDA